MRKYSVSYRVAKQTVEQARSNLNLSEKSTPISLELEVECQQVLLQQQPQEKASSDQKAEPKTKAVESIVKETKTSHSALHSEPQAAQKDDGTESRPRRSMASQQRTRSRISLNTVYLSSSPTKENALRSPLGTLSERTRDSARTDDANRFSASIPELSTDCHDTIQIAPPMQSQSLSCRTPLVQSSDGESPKRCRSLRSSHRHGTTASPTKARSTIDRKKTPLILLKTIPPTSPTKQKKSCSRSKKAPSSSRSLLPPESLQLDDSIKYHTTIPTATIDMGCDMNVNFDEELFFNSSRNIFEGSCATDNTPPSTKQRHSKNKARRPATPQELEVVYQANPEIRAVVAAASPDGSCRIGRVPISTTFDSKEKYTIPSEPISEKPSKNPPKMPPSDEPFLPATPIKSGATNSKKCSVSTKSNNTQSKLKMLPQSTLANTNRAAKTSADRILNDVSRKQKISITNTARTNSAKERANPFCDVTTQKGAKESDIMSGNTEDNSESSSSSSSNSDEYYSPLGHRAKVASEGSSHPHKYVPSIDCAFTEDESWRSLYSPRPPRRQRSGEFSPILR